jgi:phage-related minor tail protein
MSFNFTKLKESVLNATTVLGVKATAETIAQEFDLKANIATLVATAKKYATKTAYKAAVSYSNDAIESIATQYSVAKEVVSSIVNNSLESASTNYVVAKDFIINNVDTAKEVAQVALNTTVEYAQENSTPLLIGAGIGMGACAVGYCAYNYFNNKELVEDNNESGFFSSLLSYIE